MTLTRFVTGVVVLAFASIAGAESPQPLARDEQDFVFFDRPGPIHLRLHLQVEGRSFQAQWDDIIARLFRFLDFDGDGRLSAKEAEHAPSVTQLRGMIQSKPDIEADEAPSYSELTDDPKSGVSMEQLKAYYHRVGVAPWQVDWVNRMGIPDHLDDEILKTFGTEEQTCLTEGRFRSVLPFVRKYDSDSDDTISALELHQSGYAGGFSNAVPFQAGVGPFFLVDRSDKGRVLLGAALLARYDVNKDGRLTNAEILLPPGTFARLDRNGDASLDAVELADWVTAPPDLAVVLRLDGSPGDSAFVLPGSLSHTVKRSRIGATQLPLRDDQIEILRMGTMLTRQEQFQTMSSNSFASLDTNKDNVLDSSEVSRPPFEMVALLRLADRDGDGKISLDEFRQFLEVQKKVITRSVFITLVDRGRSLFDFLDEDHDHRLSRRELASGFRRLAPWADGRRGEVERGRVPRQFQILVSHGRLPLVDTDPGMAGGGRPESRLQGPTWFRKMDRNADGDVSAEEFLGTREQFKRLDLDGDGLIGLDEARAATPIKK